MSMVATYKFVGTKNFCLWKNCVYNGGMNFDKKKTRLYYFVGDIFKEKVVMKHFQL